MFFTLRFPRRRVLLLAAALGAVCALVFALRPSGVGDESAVILADEDARLAYLSSLGWEVVPDSLQQLTVALPQPLDETYLRYNELQLQQGFDLRPYAGQTLLRCAYAVANHPRCEGSVQLDLYLTQEGQLVAGDVICTGEKGYLAGLAYPK